MSSATIAFILYVVGSGNLPVLTPLGAFETKDACKAAETAITEELKKGEEPQLILCFSADSLMTLGKVNGVGEAQ